MTWHDTLIYYDLPLISLPGLSGSGSLLPLPAVLFVIFRLGRTETTARRPLHRVGLRGLVHRKILFYLIRKTTDCTSKHFQKYSVESNMSRFFIVSSARWVHCWWHENLKVHLSQLCSKAPLTGCLVTTIDWCPIISFPQLRGESTTDT